MPADIKDILARGGKPRVALLQYCVMSVQVDPVFVFLVEEYRLRPTHDSALALYEVFCAPGAPARMHALPALAATAARLEAAVRPLREQSLQMRLPEPPEQGTGVPLTAAPRYLFDFAVDALREYPAGSYAAVERTFDPGLTPAENLQGGTMNPAQRHFVEHVWRPVSRPRLVQTGFWQVATI